MKSVWRNLCSRLPVISNDKVSLPFCAFGAGLGHAAALALILPVVISLPAPSEGVVPAAVAIHVEVMKAPAPPRNDPIAALLPSSAAAAEAPMPSPDVIDEALASEPLDASNETPDDITGTLPDAVLTETPDAAALPEAPSAEGLVQEDAAPTETVPSTVAAIDPDALADVPIPSRKPRVTFEGEASEAAAAPKKSAAPSAPSRHVPRARPVVKKRLLGGRPPIGTFEYPVPGRLPGSG